MKRLKLKQGTDEWLEARLDHYTASEASAMMGDSAFMSRNQLLALKKGWKNNPNDSFKEQLFRKGHEYEAEARPIVELQQCEEFEAVVGSVKVGKLELLASYDGLAGKGSKALPWEHKTWNEILAENVRNGILTGEHFWQLEHQLLVAGVDKALFTVSNGTESKMISMVYTSVPERRQALIDGWNQFDKDLIEFKIEARQELVTETKIEALPVVEFELKGTAIASNIKDCLDVVKSRAQFEMSRVLESDEDFATKEAFNKTVKKARENLKNVVNSAESKFASFAEFKSFAGEFDTVLQQMQSHGEKQVSDAKIQKKESIKNIASARLEAHIITINEETKPVHFSALLPDEALLNFDLVMKNKRTIESLQSAADQEVARVMIIINSLRETVINNLASLREHAEDYKFLFTDINNLIIKDNEALVAIIKLRISEHITEQQRVENERIEPESEPEAKPVGEIVDNDPFGVDQGPEGSSHMDGSPEEEFDLAPPPVEGQPTLGTRLKFWAFDSSIPDQPVRNLVEILNKYGHPDLSDEDIL